MMGNFERVELSKNRIEINVAAIDPGITERSGLRYYLDIFVPDGYLSTTYKKLITLEASEVPPYERSGVMIYEGAYFSIEKYIDGFLSYNVPAFGQKTVSVADELTLPYRLIKRRMNGSSPIDEESVIEKYVLKAGIEEDAVNGWGEVLFTDTENGLGGKFLTWERGKRSIRPEQQVYLYFLLNHSVTPEKLNVMLAINEGVSEVIFGDIEVAGGFSVYCIPVGIEALGLDAIATVVETYKVWVADENGERISEIQEFLVDGSYERNERYIIYNNGLGGFDTLLCRGASTETLSVVREESERYLPFLSSATYSERVVNEVTGERELRVSFGKISTDELDKLRELMFAREIYLQSERAYLPLRLTDESLMYAESDVFVRGRAMVFRYGNRQYNFSRLGAAPPAAQRATAWRGFGTPVCLQNSRGLYTNLGVYSKLERYYLDDSSSVIPAEIKNNTIGTEGYIGAIITNVCSITPFLNDAITRASTFKKNDCAVNYVGNHPNITITAGQYGSTISKADANAKAEAAWALLNNQATANATGVCSLAVGSGFATGWHNYTETADANGQFVKNFDFENPTVTQVNTNVSHTERPGSIAENQYAVRWVGKLKGPITGVVNFEFEHDDGVRMWVDGVQVLNEWGSNGIHGFSLQMTKDELRDVRIEFYQYYGPSWLYFRWQYAGQAKIIVPTSYMLDV